MRITWDLEALFREQVWWIISHSKKVGSEEKNNSLTSVWARFVLKELLLYLLWNPTTLMSQETLGSSPGPFASLKHHKMAHWGLLVAIVPLKLFTAANLRKCGQKDLKAKLKDWLFVKISLFPVMFFFIIKISRWNLNYILITTGIKVIFSQCWLFFLYIANKIWRGSCFFNHHFWSSCPSE